MTKLRRISAQQAIRRLEKLGFQKIRQNGSHIILKKSTEDGEIGCVVPLHSELAIGTLAGILRQAKITNDEFMKDI